jgi:hypothetical protein
MCLTKLLTTGRKFIVYLKSILSNKIAKEFLLGQGESILKKPNTRSTDHFPWQRAVHFEKAKYPLY